MFLLLDHYDSFTDNLARYFTRLGASVDIREQDRIEPTDLNPADYCGLILSPGPGRPEQATAALQLLDLWSGCLPILGICLGHQIIAHYFKAAVVQTSRPRHGYNSLIRHDGAGLFAGLPSPFSATRYHSLVVDPATLPSGLIASAWSLDDQAIMALRHQTLAIESVQFHPEALLTEHGLALLQNFISLCQGQVTSSRQNSGAT
ncbi:MAG: aminodeoxychorismate/anthranilate synthase component II [Clostridia bacterium]|nr:aminodeoxychorismate/anthranilate synthase component II [Clostridia bacterium]